MFIFKYCHNHALIAGDGRGFEGEEEFDIEATQPCFKKSASSFPANLENKLSGQV